MVGGLVAGRGRVGGFTPGLVCWGVLGQGWGWVGLVALGCVLGVPVPGAGV